MRTVKEEISSYREYTYPTPHPLQTFLFPHFFFPVACYFSLYDSDNDDIGEEGEEERGEKRMEASCDFSPCLSAFFVFFYRHTSHREQQSEKTGVWRVGW